METQSPLQPSKKSFVTTLMEAATLRTPSFKEDAYFISNLKTSEKKALQDLRDKLSVSYSDSSSSCCMWGIPLLARDEKSDVILLKFLRARDFKVSDALNMLEKCLAWRKEFGADDVVEEELGFKELEGAVAYMHGYDREGHPVCYNAYGVFKDKEMYERIFGDEEKLKKFLRWRVQVLERGINLLHFKPGGVNSLIQVTDLKDMPKRELRVASNQILSLFQDNYPEMVARKIFINVPWYFSMLYSMFSPFLTQRTKSKFVISKEGNVAETLYKFIRPEDVPVQYGGLSRPGDSENSPLKPASEFTVKGGEKVNIQIEGIEAGATITWDIVVGGWDLANFNSTGSRPMSITLWAVTFTTVKKTLSRLLLLVVSMGYGVVRPTLGGITSKVLSLGLVYFVASEALELVDHLGNINDLSKKTKLFLVLPVIFLDSCFIVWIFSSLSKTLEKLQMRRNMAKLELYRKFTNSLAVCVLLSVAWIGFELYFNATDPLSEFWQVAWIIPAFWTLLAFFLLVVLSCMCILLPSYRLLSPFSSLATVI